MGKSQPANFNKTDYKTLPIIYISLYSALLFHCQAKILCRSWPPGDLFSEDCTLSLYSRLYHEVGCQVVMHILYYYFSN